MLQTAIEKISLLLAVLFCVIVMASAMVHSSLLTGHPRTGIVPMVNAKAELPFVKRTLLPIISNALVFVVPASTQRDATRLLKQLPSVSPVKEMIKFSRWSHFRGLASNPRDGFRVLIVLLCMFSALIAYALALRKTSALLFPGRPYLPEITMGFGLLLAASLVNPDIKLYDFPAMALTMLGLLFMHMKRWGWYIAVFIMACLNKESAILLTIACGLYYWNIMPKKQWLDVMGVQVVLWGLITALLHTVYDKNPGAYLFHIWMLPAKEITFMNINSMVALVAFCWLIFSRWQEIPRLLKHGCIIIFGCAASYLLFGSFKEYRVFYECLPVVALIGGYSLYRLVMPQTHSQYSDRISTADRG